jgi:hypothetical protein
MRWHSALAEASPQFAPVTGAQLIQLRQSVRRQAIALGAGRAVLRGKTFASVQFYTDPFRRKAEVPTEFEPVSQAGWTTFQLLLFRPVS